MTLSRVGSRPRFFHQSAFFKALQHAAEIATVQSQLSPEGCRSEIVVMCELVKDADLGKRERTIRPALPQDSDQSRVEPVEASYCFDGVIWFHRLMVDEYIKIIDSVNRLIIPSTDYAHWFNKICAICG